MIEQLTQLFLRLVMACEMIAQQCGRIANALDSANGAGRQHVPEYGPEYPASPAAAQELGPRASHDRRERRQSDISDVSLVTPGVLERSNAAMVNFAIDGMKVPWSDAHMRSLLEYEQKIAAAYGPEAIDQLPWRQVVPRGVEIERYRE